jgi:hypothetical protein
VDEREDAAAEESTNVPAGETDATLV